jgi:hypothetical protein
MPVVGGSKKPDPENPSGRKHVKYDPPKEGEPVYREGQRDKGREAITRGGERLGRFPTPAEAADVEQAAERNKP